MGKSSFRTLTGCWLRQRRFPRAISERHATYNLGNQNLRTIFSFAHLLDDFLDRALILDRQPSAQAVTQELPRQLPDKVVFLLQQHLLQPLRAVELRPAWQLAVRIDRLAGLVRPPAAKQIVILQPEANRVN